MGRTISDIVAVMMNREGNTTAATFSMTQREFDDISREALHYGDVSLVSWNPLLRTDEERSEFERYAESARADASMETPCLLCGNTSRGIQNPEKQIALSDDRQYTCGEIEAACLEGNIVENSCEETRRIALEQGCICHDLDF